MSIEDTEARYRFAHGARPKIRAWRKEDDEKEVRDGSPPKQSTPADAHS